MSNEFVLTYGQFTVGRIREAFCADDTWHGIFESGICAADHELAQRLFDFVQFCEEWNERERNGLLPDPAEFGRYRDLTSSGLWCAVSNSGDRSQIEDAPVFFAGGDISWRERK